MVARDGAEFAAEVFVERDHFGQGASALRHTNSISVHWVRVCVEAVQNNCQQRAQRGSRNDRRVATESVVTARWVLLFGHRCLRT